MVQHHSFSSVPALLIVGGLSCGGTSGTVGSGAAGGAYPAGGGVWSSGALGGGSLPGSSLVSTCDDICNRVLASCVNPPLSQDAYPQCLNACQYLDLVQSSCAADFAAYLACLAGANSVTCTGDGQYVVLSPPSCDAQRAAYAACTGGPPLAACIEIASARTSCPAHGGSSRALVCVGIPPSDCEPTGGLLGPYCCP